MILNYISLDDQDRVIGVISCYNTPGIIEKRLEAIQNPVQINENQSFEVTRLLDECENTPLELKYIDGEFIKSPRIFLDEDKLDTLRSMRTQLLLESDWTVLPDSQLSDQKKAEWITYRQELRDITISPDLTIDNLENFAWPTPPE